MQLMAIVKYVGGSMMLGACFSFKEPRNLARVHEMVNVLKEGHFT